MLRVSFFVALLVAGCDTSLEPIVARGIGTDAGPTVAPRDLPSGGAAGRVDAAVPQPGPGGDASLHDAALPGALDAGPPPVVRVEAVDYDDILGSASGHEWVVSTLSSGDAGTDAGLGDAFLQALPDTSTDLETGRLNNDPELGPVVSYLVRLPIPGRYIVWVRAFPTDGKDNSVHVGLDGSWPDSGRRLQFPGSSNDWVWASHQRDSGNMTFGVPGTIYLDVNEAGLHIVSFGMREDGFRFDAFILTTDPDFRP